MLRKIVKTLIPTKLFEAVEPVGHLLEAVLASIVYGFPARKLKVIGVTGTDGKTTTCTLITAMMRDAGLKVGMITTISIDDGHKVTPNPTRLTAVTSFALQKHLRHMARSGVEWLVLETTSHALAQNRYWGVPYSVAAMTNITHEHLDYHKTFENYRDAKKKLFTLAARNRNGLRTGIINAEDPSAELFRESVPHSITYGLHTGDMVASHVVSSASGNKFTASYKHLSLQIDSKLPGSFNVYNCMAAAAVGAAIGLTDPQIEHGIALLESVEGRMNTISEGQDFAVIVDYAHTPESFEKVFNELRPLTAGRLIVVFGSAGRRDKAKRAIQGEVAGRLCDVVVVTEEDDRDEDGLAIMHEIADGAKKEGKQLHKDLFLIHEREQAIDHAIGLAKAGDTVVMLGKGHEKSILTNKGKKPWDEARAAREALKKRAA